MASLRVRINEGSDKQPILLWDSVWFPWRGAADWAIAGSEEPQNRGGLQAKGALHTAVILSLFSTVRISARDDLQGIIRQRAPGAPSLHPTAPASIALFFCRQDRRLCVDRFNDRVRCRRKEPIDQVRARDRF
jgi:hypothetical protein